MSIQQIENNEVGSSVRAKLNTVIDNVNDLDPAGLVSGTGANSIKSADHLTDIVALANGEFSVALGSNARALDGGFGGSIAIGRDSSSTRIGIGIGRFARAAGDNSQSIGFSTLAGGPASVQMGGEGQSNGFRSIGMANGVVSGGDAIKLGAVSSTSNNHAIIIGSNSRAGVEGISIGRNIPDTTGNRHIRIGFTATTTGDNSIAIGSEAAATVAGAIAIGAGVTAATANYTTTKALQLTSYETLDFANDAAADVGGVPLGGIYHTAGALKIRIV